MVASLRGDVLFCFSKLHYRHLPWRARLEIFLWHGLWNFEEFEIFLLSKFFCGIRIPFLQIDIFIFIQQCFDGGRPKHDCKMWPCVTLAQEATTPRNWITPATNPKQKGGATFFCPSSCALCTMIWRKKNFYGLTGHHTKKNLQKLRENRFLPSFGPKSKLLENWRRNLLRPPKVTPEKIKGKKGIIKTVNQLNERTMLGRIRIGANSPTRLERGVVFSPPNDDLERVRVDFHESHALIWINVWLGARDIDYTILAGIISQEFGWNSDLWINLNSMNNLGKVRESFPWKNTILGLRWSPKYNIKHNNSLESSLNINQTKC